MKMTLQQNMRYYKNVDTNKIEILHKHKHQIRPGPLSADNTTNMFLMKELRKEQGQLNNTLLDGGGPSARARAMENLRRLGANLPAGVGTDTAIAEAVRLRDAQYGPRADQRKNSF